MRQAKLFPPNFTAPHTRQPKNNPTSIPPAHPTQWPSTSTHKQKPQPVVLYNKVLTNNKHLGKPAPLTTAP
jgi:hypothetical protein